MTYSVVKAQVHIRITGNVQGVFFRRSAKDEADRLAICGWVRNDRDGSVEIVAVGPKEKLEKFTKWCKKGPPLARIEKVEVDWSNTEAEFNGFEII